MGIQVEDGDEGATVKKRKRRIRWRRRESVLIEEGEGEEELQEVRQDCETRGKEREGGW